MEEEVEKQGTPIWTLVKAVCKKWLLIGFCAIFGGLIACVYAFTARPLTQDVYQATVYLNQSNAGTDKDIVFDTANNRSNIMDYFKSPAYKQAVYLAVKDNVFTDVADGKAREAKFNGAVSVSGTQGATIFVMDQTEETARVILKAFVKQAEDYVNAMMDNLAVPFEGQSIVKIKVYADSLDGPIVKANPKKENIEGYVGTKNRLMTVVIGVVLGIVAGAAVALCLYYFNNRINSSHALTAMGFPAVFAVKNGRGRNAGAGSAALEENASRYPFVIEKKGCRAVTFVSPEKTAETRKALEFQAEALRGRGYKTVLLEQGAQTRDEWKELLDKNSAGNDFILIDAPSGNGFDCAAAASFADGVTVIIDQKRAKLKDTKHTKEILDTAKLNVLSALVVNTKEDFIS